MSARIIMLPRTQAGKDLLREVARSIGGWGRHGGVELEAFDWDSSAVELERLYADAPQREVR